MTVGSPGFVLVAFGCGASIVLAACSDTLEPSDEPDPPLPELIVYSSNPPGVTEEEGREIYVMRPDGSDVEQLTTDMFAIAPAWSPDGTMIAFGSAASLPGWLAGGDGHIYVMNADGTDLRPVTSGPGNRAQPSWSPDGRRIAFTVLGDPDLLYTVDVDGGEPTLLHECEFGCQWSAWSPDGSRIAFVARPPTDGQTRPPQIHLLGLDGDSPVPPPTELGTGFPYEHLPAWSPDGSVLAFSGCPDAFSCHLFLASPDGTAVEAVTTDGLARSSPAFSRDGSSIVYYQHDEPVGIYLLELDGGEPELIQGFPESHAFFPTPRWRP